MKREGRQHGMVQTCLIISSPWNPRRNSSKSSNNRLLASSPTTSGPFTKVAQKPTNRSKFTGKCGRPRCASCHILPACKSKDKTKGTLKLKSCDVVTNYRLVTWRVVDSSPGFNLTGFSATGILDHLANHDDDCYGDDDAFGDHEFDDDHVYGYYHRPSAYDDDDDDDDQYQHPADHWLVDSPIAASTSNIVAIEELQDEFDHDDDDDTMSSCDVGFEWEQVEDEEEGDEEIGGWCLVGEI